jgi:hypothetical protein
MNILAPLGLIALIGIPLVILFHMRHFTPIERMVPSLRFWQAAEPTRTEDSRFRLPPLTVLLLLQLLAAGLLGLALARPAVSSAWSGITQRTELEHLVIVLDGSTSMSATDTPDGSTRFEAARERAVDALGALREGDTATVLVLGTQIATFQASQGAEIDDLAGRLRRLDPRGGIADLDAALRLVADLDLPGVREQILLLSDGATSADPALVEELGAPVDFERFGEQASPNLAITGLTSRPSRENPARADLFLQVANFSDERQATTLLVVADDFEAYREELTLDPNSATDIVVDTLPENAGNVIAEVRSNDVFFADNQATISLEQESDFALRILLVSDSLSHLQQALSALPGATVVTISSAEQLRGEAPPGPYDLLVYDGSTPSLGDVPDIPVLLVNSPRDGLIPTSGMMTAPTIARIRANDPVLRGVDLAGLTLFETPVHELDGTAVEIAGAEGGPLLYRAQIPGGEQPMIVIAFDLEQSNLPRRIAFPILIANIVGELSPNPLPATIPLGDPVTYSPHAAAQAVRITDPAGVAVDLPIPETPDREDFAIGHAAARDVTFTATGTAGVYQLAELDGADRTLADASFVVNAGHPRESDLRANVALPEALAATTTAGESSTRQTLSDLWPALAALALAILAIEWLWAAGPRRSRRVRAGIESAAGRGVT